MKPAEILRELMYPLGDLAIIMAMFFFLAMFNIAKLLASVSGIIGILLALTLLFFLTPAYFRYLLYVLEARAHGHQAPVPAGEIFDPTDNLWTLTPLVLFALLIWGGIVLSGYGYIWSLLYGIAFLFVVPASLAILAITHSPVESLNPAAIARMFGVCGPSYFLAPAAVLVLAILLLVLHTMGTPALIIELGAGYLTILMITLTGSVLRINDVVFEVDIGPALEPSEKQIAGDLEKEREKVATHAYGFISRGNREGGFAHIMDWIRTEPDVHEALAWFFRKMMKWESKEPALLYAQTYLAHLLHHDEDAQALKLISICLHENPRWKPKSEDRQHVLDLVAKYRRDDLLLSLRN
jgi:hypothetical protein